MFAKYMAKLKGWCAHGNAKGFSLVTARYDTAVVARQNDHGSIFEFRAEYSLAAYKEIVAINQRKNRFHDVERN